MFNINWDKLINNNLDLGMRKPKRVNRFKVAVYEVKKLHLQFLSFRDSVLETLNHNGQVIYLEKILNDKYDPTNRDIYISDALASPYFINKKSEPDPPVYLYKKYNPVNTYAVDEYCVFTDNVVYKCVISTSASPAFAPSKWSAMGTVKYLLQKQEYLFSYNFIVNVPNTVLFDTNEMKALVNKFKQAGKKYIIITY
jgi:hypothetical protein